MESNIFLVMAGFGITIYLIIKQKDEITMLRENLFHTHELLTNLLQKLDLSKPISNEQTEINLDQPTALTPVELNIETAEIPITEETITEETSKTPPPIPAHLSELADETLQTTAATTAALQPPIAATEQAPEAEQTPEAEQAPEQEFVPQLSWFEKFKQKNPDAEKFIGENLINKIGILILVLGISFFVKYAIDQNWINEPSRVGIGFLAGGILLGIAHRLRSNFQAFSSIFVAGGIAVFYLTVGIAYHDYGLFSQSTAFIIMVLITVFSALVSIAYNRQELAILTLIGGFGVPFMVSNGSGNYHVLFTYLAILNIGMLIISYYRRWIAVNFTAFGLTILMFAAWYINADISSANTAAHALLYLSLFYLIFSASFIVNNSIRQHKFSIFEIGCFVLNTFYYYGIGTNMLSQWQPQYLGLFTITLGIFNILYAFIMYRKYKFDRNLVYVLIGLALSLATITIPVQFEGNYISIFWACEAVMLFWLAQKSNLRGFSMAAIIVQGLAIISLFLDWNKYDGEEVVGSLGFNNIFLTGILIIGTLVYTYKLFHKYNFELHLWEIYINPQSYRIGVCSAALLLGYIVPLLDIHYFSFLYPTFTAGKMFLYLYHMLFTTALIYYALQKNNIYRHLAALLIVANTLCYIIFAYRMPIAELFEQYDEAERLFPLVFCLHFISLGALIYQLKMLVDRIKIKELHSLYSHKLTPWPFAIVLVYICSTEISIIFAQFTQSWDAYMETRTFVIKVIFPILWGLISFVFLLYGVKKNSKMIRIISLALLGITVLKLFVYDIKDVSETGKIVAFILLGALILVISFVYQKIKKLVIDNEKQQD